MREVELVGLGGEPIDVAADRPTAGRSELELDEVGARQAGYRRQRRHLLRPVFGEVDVPEPPLIGDAAIEVSYADHRPQPMLAAASVIDQHDRARIV